MLSARATLIKAAFGDYLEALRGFQIVLERCSLKGWPDKNAELRTASRIQELLYEQMAMRLNYLLTDGASDDATWHSCTSISKVQVRLQEHWKDSDEETLNKSTVAYARIQREIDDLRSVLDSYGLTAPLRMARWDPEETAAGTLSAHAFVNLIDSCHSSAVVNLLLCSAASRFLRRE
jgi:hypothetical protein